MLKKTLAGLAIACLLPVLGSVGSEGLAPPSDTAAGPTATRSRGVGAGTANRTAVSVGRFASRAGECGARPTIYVPDFFGPAFLVQYRMNGSIAAEPRIPLPSDITVNNAPRLSADCSTVYLPKLSTYLAIRLTTGAIEERPVRLLSAEDFHELPDGRVVTWTTRTGPVSVVDVDTGDIVWSVDERLGNMSFGAFSADGMTLALLDDSPFRELVVLRAGTDAPVLRLPVPELTYLSDVDVSPDGTLVLVEGLEGIDGTVRVHRLDGSVASTFVEPDGFIYGAFADDDELLLCRPGASFRQSLVGGGARRLEVFTEVLIDFDTPILYAAERNACSFTN